MRPIRFILTLLALFTSITASAYEWTDANGTVWNFDISGNNATLYNERRTPCISGTIPNNLTVPSTVYSGGTPYTVTAIGYLAFYNCSSLTTINIPSGVTIIDGNAFDGCSGLTSISIPESVTEIGEGAFHGCNSLKELIIEESNTPLTIYYLTTAKYTDDETIESWEPPFYNVPLQYVYIGRTIYTIQGNEESDYYDTIDGLFRNSTSLKNVEIAATCQGIENNFNWLSDEPFDGCNNITSLIVHWQSPKNIRLFTQNQIPTNTILYVPNGCRSNYENNSYWSDYKKDEYIVFSDESVGTLCLTNWDSNNDGVFSKTEAAAVTSLGDVFRNNTSITSFNELQYFTGLTEINDDAFRNTTALSSVIIPENVTRIGEYAFAYSGALTTVQLPEGLTTVDDYAFISCKRLKNISFPASLRNIGEAAFDLTGLESLILPEGVETIGYSAFTSCESLATLSVPSTVTNIGEAAFSQCGALHTIVVSENNAVYDSRDNCNALIETATNKLIRGGNQTVIPNGIASIIGYAFNESNISEINIPSSVTSIGNYAFWNCNNLTLVKVDIESPLTITNTTFKNSSRATLYVPFGCKTAYQAAQYWQAFGTIVEVVVNASGITLNQSTLSFNAANQTATLTATVTPENATNKSVTWTSSNTNVATVSSTGVVTAIADGTATITATTADGTNLSATCEVTVAIPVPATGITLSQSTLSFNAANQTATLTATVTPANATNKGVTWTSSNTAVATVSSAGVVTAIADGTATITATTADGTNLSATCEVTVAILVPATGITLSQSSLSFNAANQTATLTATVTPSNATNKSVTWTSSNTHVARVNSTGVVTAISNGTAIITATTADGTNLMATCEVTVAIPLIITFANSKVKALCVANWDTNGDGELDEAEAAAVTSLGTVFRNNKNITSFNELQYFTGLTSIGDEAFWGCDRLKSIKIPNSVTTLNELAFYNCTSLASATIGNSVTTIESAFFGCSSLTSITIPNSVTTIGENAFKNCTGLLSITISGGVTSFASNAFSGCSSVENIIVASNNSVFDSRDNCNAVIKTATNELVLGCKGTVIPESVTSIGASAFQTHSSLSSISIPSNILSIGNYAFSGCAGLTSVTIPESVTSIGTYAFSRCAGLTSITIPNSVSSISNSTFQYCSGLTSVNIGSGVTSIGSKAFANCSSLTSISIPEGVTTIEGTAFDFCDNLATVILPQSLQSIGGWAFRSSSSNLASVTVMTANPIRIDTHAWDYSPTYPINANATLYVPAGSKARYQGAVGWRVFPNIVEYDVDCHINASNMSTTAGATMHLPISVTDEGNTTGVQFDLHLPAGLSIATDNEGYVKARMGSRSNGHTYSASKIDDSHYSFAITNMQNRVLQGTTGTVLIIEMNVDQDIVLGNHDLFITDAKLSVKSGTDQVRVDLCNTSSTISVSEALPYVPGDVNGDGDIDIVDVTSTISHVIHQTPSVFILDAADVNNDGDVDIVDVTTIIDMVLNKGRSQQNIKREWDTLEPE